MSFQDPGRVMGHSAGCTPQSAPIVAMLPGYPLGRVETGPCTAAIAIAKADRAGKPYLNINACPGLD